MAGALNGNFSFRSSSLATCGPVDGGPGVATDKEDYQPGETVIITGCAFEAYEGQVLSLSVTRPNGVVDSTTVTVSSGGFTYNYVLNGITGTYTIKVEQGGILLASETFTDHTSSTVVINNNDPAVHTTSVTLTVAWSGTGGDPTQARFANVTPTTLGCPGPLDPSWSAWMATSPPSPDTFPWTLAAGPEGHRKVCAQTGHGPLGSPTPGLTLTADDTIWYTVANPPLGETCGLDMVLVIDSSGSINATELAQMKSAFNDFVAAFLPETPTEIAVVDFDNLATVIQPFTNNETALNNAINSVVAGGNTNWDDALFDARSLYPHRSNADLMVFASDGNPNRIGHVTSVAVTEQDAMDAATDESDIAKTANIRILGVGIGSDLDAVNMNAVTGNVTHPPAPIDENVDLITTDFSTMAADLSEFVLDICAGITVHKVIDADGNLGTTGDQTTSGTAVDNWCYTPTSSGGTVTPPSDCTDNTGTTTTFQITPSGTYTVSMAETIKPGYGLVGASCTGATNNGAFDGADSVDGIVVDSNDIVSCTFYNTELGSIAWEKRDESQPANPLQGGASFTVGGAAGPFGCTGDPTNPITVVDNGTNDADPDPGQIQLNDVCPGVYTVTETGAPTGYARDDDTTRSVTVASPNLVQVIGTQGVDDPGNTDESDFHNRLGSLAWEKRQEVGSPPHPLQGGATFTVGGSSGPFACTGNATNPITVVDNGANDADPDPGQILVNNVCLGSYTVTETVAPTGYAVDDDPTRAVTVSEADLNNVIGTQGTDEDGNTDESDFHNRLGSLAWEKRTEVGSPPPLQGGATFTVGGISGPFACNGDATNPITVVDNGANDADPDPGQILVNNVCLGSYTVTETVAPSGFALDDDPTRAVTVSTADLNAVIGTQGTDDPGNTDESDFHNRLGSIEWEKRAEVGSPPPLLVGATFTVGGSSGPFACAGDATNPVTVVDNGSNDADPDPGQIRLNNVCLGSYTVTETVPPAGYTVDDDTSRAVTVSVGDLNAVIGTQGSDDPGNTDESDFHNAGTATITITKDAQPNDPQDFSFSGTCFAPFSLDDDGTNGNPLSNSMTAAHVAPDSCTVIENAPPAPWVLTTLVCSDPDSGTTTSVGTRTATIDLDPGEAITCTFTNVFSPTPSPTPPATPTPTPPATPTPTAGGATATPVATASPSPTPTPAAVGGIAGLMDAPQAPQSVDPVRGNGPGAWPVVLVFAAFLTAVAGVYLAHHRRTG